MTDDRGTLRSIAWRELFPWLVIFRTFWLSLSVPLLALATLGVLVQPLGWMLADLIFIDDLTIKDRHDFAVINESLTTWSGSQQVHSGVAESLFSSTSLRRVVAPERGDYAGTFDRLSFPFVELFNGRLTLGMFCYFLFGGLWMLALWALIGGAITRVAVMYLGLEERPSIKDALGFTLKRYSSYVSAPLYPLLGIALLALPIMLAGLFMSLDFGALLVGIFWIFALIAALGMALLAIGLLFGWPLMWPAVSAENGDAFEALSRSFGYTFQRPFHYLFYALVATLFAAICWIFVHGVAELVVHLGWWSASWGAGYQGDSETLRRVEWLRELSLLTNRPPDGLHGFEVNTSAWWGTRLLGAWNELVRSVAEGFALSLFFCLASAVYLLLRQVDDETEFDEIYTEDDDERFTLPEVKRDAAGVTTMPPASSSSPDEVPPPDRPLAEEE